MVCRLGAGVNRMLKSLVRTWLVCGLVFAQIGFAAESTHWERFDEQDDLALLAEHSNESMRFRLLQSQTTDKNLWWQPFLDELEVFSEARYAALKPLVLDQAISSLQRSIAAGEFSYEELTLFYLYRIRAIETDSARYLNAVISLNPDALAAARRADAELASGRSIDENSVFGMPVLLKDNIGSEGSATTAGAVVLQQNVTGDAFITRQLRAAGAVILGKANLSEWAYFFCEDCPSGYSALGGQTLNPYGRFEFGTGGSSSGSGAAAAANLAAATVGSETSGSILSPASSNSVVGLKPTTGSLSRSGIVPISSTLDTAGPITRYVADAVALFNAMAGYDEADAAMPLISADFHLEIRDVPLAGKRLGVLEDYVDDELFQASLRLLSDQDASLIEMRLPEFDSSGFGELLGGEMLLDLASYLDTWAHEDVSVGSVADVQAVNNIDPELHAPYGQALFDMMAELSLSDSELSTLRERLQSGARAALDSLFENHRLDVLLSINNRNAGIAALANYPALTIPMGYQEDGRPMGLTLIAPPFNEQELIDIGLQFERLSSARRMPDAYR